MITLLLVSSALVITAYYALLMVNKYITVRNIPGRKGLPLIGNAYEVLTNIRSGDKMWRYVKSVCDELSKPRIFKIWVCGLLIVGLADPDHIEIFYNSPNSSNKGSFYDFMFGDLLHGVFTMDGGKKWKGYRKAVVKSTHKILTITKYHKYFVASANNLVSNIRKKCNIEDNIHHELEQYFLYNITETLGGLSLEHVKSPYKYKLLENINQAVEMLSENIFRYCYFWKFGMKINNQFERYEHYKKEIFGVVEEIIETKLTNFEKKGGSLSYIEHFISASLEENWTMNKTCRTFIEAIFGSGDTALVTTRCALVFLAVLPEIQEKAYQEQFSIFGDSSRDPTPEDVESMTYLRMVINETLRQITAPVILRSCNEAMKIGKYTIPKGTIIIISTHSVHHNPEYWERPDDFFPEHFSPDKEKERPNFAYMPFGGGPRMCPGYNYAISMISIVLSNIIRNFHLSTSVKYEDIRFKYVLFLQLKNKYSIKFVERNKHLL